MTGSEPPGRDPHRVEQAVGWVRPYRQELEQWRQWIEVGMLTEQFVKTHGLSAGMPHESQHRLARGGAVAPDPAAVRRADTVCEAQEGAKAKAGERLVGSSEVIESIFGGWRRLEGEHPPAA